MKTKTLVKILVVSLGVNVALVSKVLSKDADIRHYRKYRTHMTAWVQIANLSLGAQADKLDEVRVMTGYDTSLPKEVIESIQAYHMFRQNGMI